MTMNGEDRTPPDGIVSTVHQHDSDIEALKKAVSDVADGVMRLETDLGAMMRELGLVRTDMTAGFSRIGSLADDAFRRAETSSHDLSEFKLDVRKAILMKLNWPSAVLVLAFVGAAFAFPYFHVPQPDWLVGLEIAAGGVLLNQFKPALTTPDKP